MTMSNRVGAPLAAMALMLGLATGATRAAKPPARRFMKGIHSMSNFLSFGAMP